MSYQQELGGNSEDEEKTNQTKGGILEVKATFRSTALPCSG